MYKNRITTLIICVSLVIFAATNVYSEEIVAEINGQKITRTEFGDFLIKAYGDTALDFLIKKMVVGQQAKKANVKIPDDELQLRLKTAANAQIVDMMREKGITSKDDLELELFKTGITFDKFRNNIIKSIRNQAELELLVEKMLIEDIMFTEDELVEAYKNMYGEKIRANQIVLKTRKKADEVINKLKGGAEFGKLAQKESIDRASAARGGEMMPLSIEGPLGKACASLKAGTISGVVETGYGYHILQMVEKLPGSDKKFDEVIDVLESVVKREKLNQKVQPWIRELFEKAKVEVNL